MNGKWRATQMTQVGRQHTLILLHCGFFDYEIQTDTNQAFAQGGATSSLHSLFTPYNPTPSS